MITVDSKPDVRAMSGNVEKTDRDLRPIAALVVLTVLLLIPFSDKALHIDDPFYVWVAQQIHVMPWDFFGFETFWTGAVAPVWWHNKNPPGTSYFIAMAAAVFGWSERALHLAFLVPAVGAVVGTYMLAKRMCGSPFMAAVTSLVSPVFLISGTQVMCESLLLCSWVWSVLFWVDGIDRKRFVSLLASAGMVSLACLIKYPGINLIPLLFAYGLIRQRSIGWWTVALLIPVAVLAAYDMYTANLYGQGHFTDAMLYASATQDRTHLANGLTSLVFLGGCMAPVLFYLPWLCSGRQLLAFGLVTIAAIAVTPQLGWLKGHALMTDDGAAWATAIPIGLFACGGGLILVLVTRDVWKRRDGESLLLWLWIVGVFVFAGFVNWSVNGRSILPLVPAAAILLVRRVDEGQGLLTFNRPAIKLIAVLPAAVFALLPTYGDYSIANSSRIAAKEIVDTYAVENQRLWFQGHWGFQWYIESSGALPLGPRLVRFPLSDKLLPTERTSPLAKLRSGDLLIIPENNTNVRLTIARSPDGSTGVVRLGRSGPQVPISELHVHKIPVSIFTTLSGFHGAGFYSDTFGPLPFTAGPMRPETYYVVRIR